MGTGMVLRTGKDTVLGCLGSKIEYSETKEVKESAMMAEINRLGIYTSVVALVLGLLISIFSWYKVMDVLVFTSVLMITTGPSSINIVLLITLLSLAKRMARKLMLVKDLDSVSMLGDTSCVIVSLTDPTRRAEIGMTIMKCRVAGVKVIMMTGDEPSTAAAIAHTVNVVT